MNDTDFQLAQQIAKLEGTVTSEFGAINKRLDVSNGRLGKHHELIASILKQLANDDGQKQATKSNWQTLFAVVSLIIPALALFMR
ncbi:MAG TPA: hypothetical protein VJS37_03975 [Terriglobales bacterium]|nr:hypothetical protein [Terriglobales bacterium]